MAKLFDSFVPAEEILPLTQAIARVFGRLGEKKNRNRARIKFLVQDLGIEKFKELVLEERKTLAPRSALDRLCGRTPSNSRKRRCDPAANGPRLASPAFERWLKTNTRPQKQEGYVVVTVALPLGDITANQLRSLADIVRRFTKETVRTTVEQNFVIRWVSKSDLPEIYKALEAVGLGRSRRGRHRRHRHLPGHGHLQAGNFVLARTGGANCASACARRASEMDESVQNLHIKISGCFNSCGQHHVADLGFYGVSRKMGGYAVPHFQVVLGGEWEHNAGSYGLPVVAIPSKNIPEVVTRLTDAYCGRPHQGRKFQGFRQAHRQS